MISLDYYAVLQGFEHGINKISDMFSPPIAAHKTTKACLFVHFQLNGEQIHETNALSFLTKQEGGNNLIELYRLGGHTGNYWKQIAINIPAMDYNYRVGELC